MTRKPVVLCADPLPAAMRELVVALRPAEVELLFVETADVAELIAKAAAADHILCSWTPVTDAVIAAAPRLRLIQKFGIGVDKIDLESAARRGIPVCIAAGVNAVAVAETAIALMLALYKRLCVAHNSLRDGKWLKWELRTGCHELWQKTVGLIGGGAIGRAVAKRLSHGFECRVLYYDAVRLLPETERVLGMIHAPLDSLLQQADVVSLHVPLTPATRGLIGERELSRMKRSAVLINTARGGIVDEAALIAALRNGTIAGAGLDVFAQEPPERDNPLLSMDNVVVTPHNGGGTVDTMRRIVAHSFGNILRVERGDPLPPADRVGR